MSVYSLSRKKQKPLYFSRTELSRLLSAYSLRVASGEWRDYALDHLPGRAVFSVFKHAHEHPLFTIEKHILKTNDTALFILEDKNKVMLKTTRFDELLTYLNRLPRLVHS